ncbi:MAG TPA: hypothetical protein VII01_06845 [Solirubrobacteraceae bacterium]
MATSSAGASVERRSDRSEPLSAGPGHPRCCTSALNLPTTITGQNGLQVEHITKIAPEGCGVQIIG